MTDTSRIFRVAARSLVRQRRFTAFSVATLALGLAVATTFFSIFDTVLLRSLAYEDAGQLVVMLEPGRSPTSPANFADVKERSRSLQRLTAAHPWSPVLRGDGPAERISALRTSTDLFELLRARPLLGQTYVAGPVRAPGERVVVLGHGLWQRRFGGAPDIVGRQLGLDGDLFTVIGVMPEGFEFPPFWSTGAELWAPIAGDDAFWERRGFNALRVFARLAPGVEVSAAQQEIERLTEALRAEHPDDNEHLTYRVEPLSEPVVEGVRPALQTIFFGVGLVLLIAAANVAGLWLTRTASRGPELAIRKALGAPSWALWRQGLAESLCVVALAAVLGWQLALWALEAIKALAPAGVPRLQESSLDLRVLAFTAGVSAVLAAAFATILPLGGRRRPGAALAGGVRRVGDRHESAGRSWLVTLEIAMAVLLVLCSGLVAQSLGNLWRTDSGLRSE
ncbi:MAG: ABC transporter permease, partial [Acidobacteriota bacterium]